MRKLSRQEKEEQQVRQLNYPHTYGNCAEIAHGIEDDNLQGPHRFYYEAIGITSEKREYDPALLPKNLEELSRIILAQGRLLIALVDDIANIYKAMGISLKHDADDALNQHFLANVAKDLDKKQAKKVIKRR